MKVIKTSKFEKKALPNYDRGHPVGPEPQNDSLVDTNDTETVKDIEKKWLKKPKKSQAS